MAKLQNYVEIESRDKEGHLLDSRGFPSESYVIAFLDILKVQMQQVSQANVTDTGGTLRTVTITTPPLNMAAAVSVIDRGTRVGTGVAAVTLTDNKLGTKIAEGVAATQMHHEPQEFTTPATVGSTRSFTTTRVMLNDSAGGASITLNECGIYGRDTTNSFTYRLARDLVSPGIVVANLGTITIRYTIGVTV